MSTNPIIKPNKTNNTSSKSPRSALAAQPQPQLEITPTHQPISTTTTRSNKKRVNYQEEEEEEEEEGSSSENEGSVVDDEDGGSSIGDEEDENTPNSSDDDDDNANELIRNLTQPPVPQVQTSTTTITVYQGKVPPFIFQKVLDQQSQSSKKVLNRIEDYLNKVEREDKEFIERHLKSGEMEFNKVKAAVSKGLNPI
ncbi:hypothetical protein JCM5350_005322 [Sporobolomyces pararoseus]